MTLRVFFASYQFDVISLEEDNDIITIEAMNNANRTQDELETLMRHSPAGEIRRLIIESFEPDTSYDAHPSTPSEADMASQLKALSQTVNDISTKLEILQKGYGA